MLEVCLSTEKGVSKEPVHGGMLVREHGLEGDVHAGTPDRQVSLLCRESLERMQQKAPGAGPGSLAENLTIEDLSPGDFRVGTVIELQRGPVLEVTQIGKQCHSRCEIARLVGDCIMPREGVFARVVRGGEVRAGDWLEVKSDDD